MAGDDAPSPALGYCFDVRVDDVSLGLFTRIDGLSAEYETSQVREGGENGYVHTLRGRLQFGRIVLTRPVDTSSGALAAWFTSADGELGPSRSTASLAAFDGNGREVARWDLSGVYPVKYSGPSFQAGAGAVLTESVELAHNGFLHRPPVGSGTPATRSPAAPAVRPASPAPRTRGLRF